MTTREGLGFESECYRLNVAALVRVPCVKNAGIPSGGNAAGDAVGPYEYLLCKRADHDAWQCPQGGLELSDGSPALGLLRELNEELGILPEHVRIVHESKCWRRYSFQFPKSGDEGPPVRKGQQQKWFLCEINALNLCDLSRSYGEFNELCLFSQQDMVERYATWKAGPFLDFCRELGLLSAGDLNAVGGKK